MKTLQQKFSNFKIEKKKLKTIYGGGIQTISAAKITYKCWHSRSSLHPTTFHHIKDVQRWESLVPKGECFIVR
ncbi:hypothetical protein IWQ47_002292 [Aquimarina sp. EL_43]|uniref:hypothetical protein n=1 Tax=unclassified Aquimarina TaxID=2627091 RepID=UPI0018CA1200|nr:MULTISPECIES: hypothetical protein [unclassified Aquimarina]MBG6130828.1 hypothetical protein [Aquimarina sp. EL_35]MBG6151025.1 hypothetical protein [Aquimarina sp. EL_32]MBG6169218.1 hypothetical protein [Aquimarina sp. EL_43]